MENLTFWCSDIQVDINPLPINIYVAMTLYCVKCTKKRILCDPYFPVFFDYILIRESMGQGKPFFWHILSMAF